MVRLLLIRLLLKLLGVPDISKISEKKIRMFFWTAYPNQGFQDYIVKRDREILQQMGRGVSNEEYRGLLLARSELGILLTASKLAYQKVEHDRLEKIRAIKEKQGSQATIKSVKNTEPQENENTNNEES